jgi:hypothetical protein
MEFARRILELAKSLSDPKLAMRQLLDHTGYHIGRTAAVESLNLHLRRVLSALEINLKTAVDDQLASISRRAFNLSVW